MEGWRKGVREEGRRRGREGGGRRRMGDGVDRVILPF